jgi:predicted unusual protein kinase regulating ubiquinone biosynthesis (AarF/ABC1/UbiB family)
VPDDLPRSDFVRQARRRRETALSISRRIAPLLARKAGRRDVADRHIARAFRKVADDLGASYTKFGQFVASASGIFGEDVAAEFAGCLDDGPPIAFARVQRTIERDLGRPLSSLFATFDPEPIGCASIAVVHRATLIDGRDVAVKVLRPGITHTVATDLVLMRQLFAVIGRVASAELAIGLRQGVDNFEEQVREELDLRNEATAMVFYRELLTSFGLDRVTVPEPLVHLSGRRVLVMELLDGVAVHDAEELAALTDDPGPLIAEVVRAWFVTAIRSGTFHGDVHAGNLMVLRDGRIAMIDWGIVGRLQPDSHRLFRRILEGALGDEAALDDVADFFYGQAGPVLTMLGLDEAAARALIKMRARDIFTKPFGEIGFGQFLLQQGGGGLDTGIPGIREMLRDARDLPPPAEIDRGLFLLGKQLMFLESYGRRYLATSAILDDPDFFRAVLAEG